MKKKILLTIVLGAICLGTLEAQVKPSASTSLEKRFHAFFKSTSEVSWQEVGGNIWLARFHEEGVSKIAYFSSEGKLLIEGKALNSLELPTVVLTGLSKTAASYEKKVGGIRIIQAFELKEQNELQYFVNMGNTEVLLSVIADRRGRTNVISNQKIDSTSNINLLLASF